MNEVGRLSYDENNNEEEQQNKKNGLYVERHLELGSEREDFQIIPNGGSGDCMFKAVSQAVYEGDESKHREIRKRVVNFIIAQRWEKFSESIEVQHINGNNLLQRQWSKDPKEAYKMYMTLAGTLGSSSELTAAGELFHYNFATIQEYCISTEPTYRVENCALYDEETTSFHYFYFTGDYDNGHWEYIKNLTGKKLADGTYQGRHKIMINGEDINFEDWLRRETENTNEAELLKVATNHDLYVRRRTTHPFELKSFHFCRDGTVQLKGNSFTIAPVQNSDLFSVLAHECMKNEGSAHDIELILLKHRYSFFEDLNYKLITQPWSHNFTVDAIRYCGQSLKGNIQDLIGAADLYSFSFILFLKMSDDDDIHQCKFTHVDRWGGESDRILYFFMRLSKSSEGGKEQLIAKWWRLVPVDDNSPTYSDVKVFSRKSISRLDGGDSSSSRRTHSMRSSTTYMTGRPITADPYGSQVNSTKLMTRRPSSVQGSSFRLGTAQVLETAQDIFREVALAQAEPKCQVLEGGITVTRISDSEGGLETDECLKKDHEKLFGPSPTTQLSHKSSVMDGSKPSWMKKTARLVKKSSLYMKDMKNEKIKPATGSDLLKHPDKVKTLVKISDRNNSGRELTYRGSGYMKADDVLTDLRSQGLIKMPTVLSGRTSSFTDRQKQMEKLSVQRLYSARADMRQSHLDNHFMLRDENFNVIADIKEETENEGSDISFENFGCKPNESQAAIMQEENLCRQTSQGQQFPPQELLPLAREYSRGKIKKVTPEPTSSQNGYGTSFGQDYNHNENYHNNYTCLDRLLRVLGRIMDSFRNMKRQMKQGFIRRYEGLNNSSSMLVNMQKRQNKQFPRSSYTRIEKKLKPID